MVMHMCAGLHSLRSTHNIICHQCRWIVTEMFFVSKMQHEYELLFFQLCGLFAVGNSMLPGNKQNVRLLSNSTHCSLSTAALWSKKNCTLAQIRLHVLWATFCAEADSIFHKVKHLKMCSCNDWPNSCDADGSNFIFSEVLRRHNLLRNGFSVWLLSLRILWKLSQMRGQWISMQTATCFNVDVFIDKNFVIKQMHRHHKVLEIIVFVVVFRHRTAASKHFD